MHRTHFSKCFGCAECSRPSGRCSLTFCYPLLAMGSPCALFEESVFVCQWCFEVKRGQEFSMFQPGFRHTCNQCNVLWTAFWRTIEEEPDRHEIDRKVRKARESLLRSLFLFSQWRAFKSHAGTILADSTRFDFKGVLRIAFRDHTFHEQNWPTPGEYSTFEGQQQYYQFRMIRSGQPLQGPSSGVPGHIFRAASPGEQPSSTADAPLQAQQSPTPGTPSSTSEASWQAHRHDRQAGPLPPQLEPTRSATPSRKRPLSCLYEELHDNVKSPD